MAQEKAAGRALRPTAFKGKVLEALRKGFGIRDKKAAIVTDDKGHPCTLTRSWVGKSSAGAIRGLSGQLDCALSGAFDDGLRGWRAARFRRCVHGAGRPRMVHGTVTDSQVIRG